MNTRRWQITIERVVVTGGPARGLDTAEIEALVKHVLSRQLSRAPLPNGPLARATVHVESGPLDTGTPAVVRAVAAGVTSALGGKRHDG
jgi:hypothetical protein